MLRNLPGDSESPVYLSAGKGGRHLPRRGSEPLLNINKGDRHTVLQTRPFTYCDNKSGEQIMRTQRMTTISEEDPKKQAYLGLKCFSSFAIRKFISLACSN